MLVRARCNELHGDAPLGALALELDGYHIVSNIPDWLDPVYVEIILRLVSALLIGGLIGMERTYHGRPAGFRTHALVCMSTALLMLVTVMRTAGSRASRKDALRWIPRALPKAS
jgi:Uncharacterized membrane protein